MNTPLNDTTQQKARDLARQITVAHDLDPEIQEELYGHIEDKLLAYKSGEERITDEDAFILVREHFGDAKELKAMLQDVHVEVVQVTLVRRVLALVIVTSVFSIALEIISGVIELCIALNALDGGIPSRMLYQALINHACFPVLGAAIFFKLYRWRHAPPSDKLPWFHEWHLATLSGWAAILTAILWATPIIRLSSSTTFVESPYEISIVQALGTLPICVICAAWLWWSDSAKGGLAQLSKIGMLWALYSFGLSFGRSTMLIGSGDLPDIVYTKLGALEWSGVNLAFYTSVNRTTPTMLLSVLILWTTLAVLCTLIYYAVHRVRRRWAPIDLASTIIR